MASVERDQHMMIDERYLEKVAEAAKIKKTDTVLEIGAGPGNLTRLLCERAERVIALELDPEFTEQLSLAQEEMKNLDIVFGNALDYLREDRPFDLLVGNIPYAIAEAVLQGLFRKAFRSSVLTVPKGFAGRVVAEETKLGFLASVFFERKLLFDIPRTAFLPEPHTDSVALELAPKTHPDRLVQLVFQQPDKKPRNSIREALIREAQENGGKMTKNQARERLKSLETKRYFGIKISNLSLADLRFLARDLKAI